jgi:hypothetical protein
VPIVMVTGTVKCAVLADALAAGAVLHKPTDSVILVDTENTCVERARRRRQTGAPSSCARRRFRADIGPLRPCLEGLLMPPAVLPVLSRGARDRVRFERVTSVRRARSMAYLRAQHALSWVKGEPYSKGFARLPLTHDTTSASGAIQQRANPERRSRPPVAAPPASPSHRNYPVLPTER